MAKCDGGYFCKICGEYVENITTSELYLRFVLGEVPQDELLGLPDVHITCNPNLAQYIVDDRFTAPELDEPKLRKENFDPEWVKQEEARITRGWAHLQTIPGSGLPMEMYPLDAPKVAEQADVTAADKSSTESGQGSPARFGSEPDDDDSTRGFQV